MTMNFHLIQYSCLEHGELFSHKSLVTFYDDFALLLSIARIL